MPQPGFFDLDERFKKLDEKDPLVSLNELIHWEDFRATLENIRQKERKSNAGRKPFDVVMMFKVCLIRKICGRFLAQVAPRAYEIRQFQLHSTF
jgi:hypothetical protein